MSLSLAHAFTLWVRTLAVLTQVKIRCCDVMGFAGRTTTYCNPCLASAVYPRLNTASIEDSRIKPDSVDILERLTSLEGISRTSNLN